MVDKESQICEDYKNGLGAKKIGIKYGYSEQPIYRILRENNIEMRDSRQGARKYHCNQNYFENIDTSEKAYWLGFIAADGTIVYRSEKSGLEELRIVLAARDTNHLYEFRKAMSSNCPIKLETRTTNFGTFEIVRISIYSKKLCDDLNLLGIGARKTFKIKIPNIRQNLIKFFILGYWDGDGGVSIGRNKRLSFYCSGIFDLLIEIQTFL